MSKIFVLVIVLFSFCYLQAQNKPTWNEKKCAVALTYDDALNVHLDNAIPLLDSLKLKATFYLSGYSGVLNNHLNEWRAIAKKGHELANHTLYHPCIGKRPGREFVTADYDLSTYSIRRITDEIKMTNTLLTAIDGKTKRTFAYPCGDTKIGDSSYLDPVKNDFIAARGVKGEMLKINQVDLYNIGCYTINGQTGQQLIYIDPPYNTEKDFVYSDNCTEDEKPYWEQTGVTENGLKIDTNNETNGRFHSNWLNMMYSRLLIARAMLKPEGVIFISIDDNEVHHLRKLCDDVFGEENFIGTFINNSTPNARDYGHIGKMH